MFRSLGLMFLLLKKLYLLSWIFWRSDKCRVPVLSTFCFHLLQFWLLAARRLRNSYLVHGQRLRPDDSGRALFALRLLMHYRMTSTQNFLNVIHLLI